MLKIKDTKLFEKLLEDNEKFMMTCSCEDGTIKLFYRIGGLKDFLENRYYEYLEIDEATRIITGRIDCLARGLSWKTNQFGLDQIPFEIRDLVEEVSD